MNFDIVFASWKLLLQGTLTTVLLMLVVGTVAPILAFPLAILRGHKNPAIWLPIAAFSWMMRAVPTLVLLFFCYYGLPALGVYLDAVPSALLALVISALGYNIEFLRAGLLAVPATQFEAARALGIPRYQMYKRLILPQALPVALPPLFSNLTLNLKGTALAGLVSVSELTSVTSGLISETYRPIELLIAAGVIYLFLNSILILLQGVVERRFDIRGRAARITGVAAGSPLPSPTV